MRLFVYALIAVVCAVSAHAFAVVEFVPGSAPVQQESSGRSGCAAVIACSDWGACVEGVQVRSCNVTKLCGQPMPIENQSCEVPISLDAFPVSRDVVENVTEPVQNESDDSVALPIAVREASFVPLLMLIVLTDAILVGLVVRSYRRRNS